MTGRVGQHSVREVSVDGSRFLDEVRVQDWSRAVWFRDARNGQIKAKKRLERNANQRSILPPGRLAEKGRTRIRWGEGKEIVPDMRGVIKLGDHVMPVILTCETVLALCLGAEVPEN